METGDRLVQRKLDYRGAVVAQHVEKIIFISFALAFLAIVSFFTFPLSAAAAPLSQSDLVTKYCSSQPSTASVGQVTNASGFTRIGCLDASGNLINNIGFDQVTINRLAVDEGQDPGAFGTSASTIADATSSNLTTGMKTPGCNLFAWDWNTCIWNPVLSSMGQLLTGVSTWILGFVGYIFDTFITWTIVDFKGTLQTLGILQTIDTVWAVFRDIGNILIIGMFVFVAISTILSIENYGARKWIAKILIVAVLINFSMFFTTFSIDVSNFLARQFYNSMPGLTGLTVTDSTATSPSTAGKTATRKVGIAEAFVSKIGVTGVWNNGLAQTDPISIVTYSLGATLFMLFVAIVLLYGCFLLVSRAVLLLFLILTSSLAFASMLLPGDLAKKGWGVWKDSLVKVCIFAPLLMLFLFITLTVLDAGASSGHSTLGDFLTAPTKSAGNGSLTVLFIFIFASGMLFLSMKLANSFAAKIAGFNYAAALPGIGLAVGAAATSFGLRNTIGRGATRFSEDQAIRAKELTGQGRHVSAAFANIASGLGGSVGKAGFNPLNTAAGKQFTGLAGGDKGPVGGVIKSATAAGKGGFIEQEKRNVETQRKHAEKLAPTKEQQAKIREEALANANPEQKQRLATAQREIDIAKEQKTAQQQALQAAHTAEVNTVNAEIRAAAAAAAQNPQDPQSQAELENLIRNREVLETRHKQAMAAAEAPHTAAQLAGKEAEEAIIPKESRETTTKGDNMADIAHRRIANVPYRIAKVAASKIPVVNLLPWARPQTTANDKVAQKVRGAATKKEKADAEAARLTALVGNATVPTPPAAAPGTPPTTP